MNKDKIFDCIILGGGPAGLSSALYLKRAGLNCAIIDKSAIGGTPGNYCEIENYLGFNKIQGYELCEKFEQHIDCFDVQKFPYEEIQSIDLKSEIKSVTTLNNVFKAKSIIIAAGAKNKKLNIKGEQENIGRGVSYCAVCDGAFYKDKIVAVVGGGNSALEEALYLTRFAKKVYLIHRRDEFRADKIIQQRVMENKKIELILNSEVEEILADDKVKAIVVKNKNGKTKEIKTDGVFPYIGLSANVENFIGQVELDTQGFIVTDCNLKTSVDGVYAAGDIRNTPLRQVITAVSDGAIAAIGVSNYLTLFTKKEVKVNN